VKKLLILLIGILILAGCSTEETNSNVEVLFDVTPFSQITPEKLVELKGKAESIEDWEFSSPNGKKYKAKTYSYDNGNQEFMIIDKKVVRLTVRGTGQKFNDAKSVLSMYGIKPEESMSKTADTGSAIRYKNVTDQVGDFWVIHTNKSIDTLKVTYDIKYFE